jgi:DNA gyrase subunit A
LSTDETTLADPSDITPINIVDEMKTSYLDYAMSVIVSRALPDVRDGLKPVHRRILYACQEAGYVAGRPYRKSSRIPRASRTCWSTARAGLRSGWRPIFRHII